MVGAEELARFDREARVVAKLRHRGVVAVHDLGRHNGCPYLVMDLIEGESLNARLRRGPVAPMEAARMGADLADALEHAHQSGILHRDVNPANVLLKSSGGEPVLTDSAWPRTCAIRGSA